MLLQVGFALLFGGGRCFVSWLHCPSPTRTTAFSYTKDLILKKLSSFKEIVRFQAAYAPYGTYPSIWPKGRIRPLLKFRPTTVTPVVFKWTYVHILSYSINQHVKSKRTSKCNDMLAPFGPSSWVLHMCRDRIKGGNYLGGT